MTRLAPYLLTLALFLSVKALSQNQPSVQISSKESGQIAIGLLLPDQSHSDIIAAAELAIDEANKAGGYQKQEFKLVIRTAEGSWGAGSKESVNLVYEDQVHAIIGSLDGRNGHLAEQVAAKSHLSYIETYATEPSLSQAFVPWFMRVVPNDNQQASSIIDQIQMEGGTSIGILSMENYDTRYAVKSLTKVMAQKFGKSPLVIELDSSNIQKDDIIDLILTSGLDHLVIPFNANFVQDLIVTLKDKRPELNIYGTLHFTMGVEKRGSDWNAYEGVFMLAPHFDRTKQDILHDSRSAYLYDAVNMVLMAIQEVGTDREAIKDYLSKTVHSNAITGSISFDELGNRKNAAVMLRIQSGVPSQIN